MPEPEQIKEIVESKSEELKKRSNLSCDTCGSTKHSTESHGKKGGARAGSGVPVGYKQKKTLDAIEVKKAFNERIMKHADELFNAQFNLAKGEQVLMVKIKERDSKGKVIRVMHEVVDNKETIKQYLDYEDLDEGESLNDENHFYYLTTRPANNQALDSLLNRGLGKTPDKIEIEGDSIFTNPQLTIKVVGERHDLDIHADITGPGQLPGREDGDETSDGDYTIGPPKPSDTAS